MSNTWFQFKQFKIEQDRCAMKVSTDACIFGAWATLDDTVKYVLDIGAGTGLLSLMLAQRYSQIHIDAIELDISAAIQAAENAAASPWIDRINVLHGDASRHQFDKKYDFIICNPPFFQNSLLGDDAGRNKARHTDTLNNESLLYMADNLLAGNGCIGILLPAAQHLQWLRLLNKNNWHIIKQVNIQPKAGSLPNRVACICRKGESIRKPVIESLFIRISENNYSGDFINLMHPYYL